MSKVMHWNQLTLFREDSPAKTSATQDSAPESMGKIADAGRICSASFASYDRASQLWRTFQLCLTGELSEFSETWPRAGMVVNGIAYQLPPLAPLTAEIESGLWPTPRSEDSEQTGGHRGSPDTLTAAARMFRTPSSRDWKGMSAESWRLRSSGDKTPTLPDQVGGALNPEWVAWLMGFPPEWLSFERSEIPSFPKSQNGLEGE